MAVINIFSKRQKKKRGEVPDIYTHDQLPMTLKVQIVQIIIDTIGKSKGYGYTDDVGKFYDLIHKVLCREYGVFRLDNPRHVDNDPQKQVLNFFLENTDIEKNIDVIELIFRYIKLDLSKNYARYARDNDVKSSPFDSIAELNTRFKENGIGYSFEGSEIIRIDSTYIHQEVTKNTLNLLWDDRFAGANDEYLAAHDHYKHKRNKECLIECLKAMESTMKIICREKGWTYNENDTASKLIKIMFENEILPTYIQNQFTSLLSLLQSGIPTIRNRLGGHGQGQTVKKVDDGVTRYGLNLTGSNIIFLIEQSKLRE